MAVTASTLLASVASASDGQSLEFDSSRFEKKTIEVAGRTVAYRAFEGVVYVSHPVDALYESMNIYVPEAYYEGKAVGPYTAETAPIFLPNSVGGYMPGKPGRPGLSREGGPNAIAVALARGLVVAAPGARGSTCTDAAGHFSGKAPACIVDLKAAVRYLRHNDKKMPGSAEKIISNGTSAGGALSALLGASGNSADYEPYLEAIGTARERDDIFAASCYCPITNLDHADAAYEWLFAGINTYDRFGNSGDLTTAQIQTSARLKPLFPPYLNSLALKTKDGTALVLDEKGEGSFKVCVKQHLLASAQQALAAGTDLSGFSWLTIKDGKVADLDLARYLEHITRMKTPPAFDDLDLGSPENKLFGTATTDARHFTAFSAGQGSDHSLAEPAVVRLMNPMNYIGRPGATTASHWRIRHGAADRDEVARDPCEVEERLVDAVDLLPRRVLGHQRHHAAGHVAVQLDVGGQRDEPCLALQVAHLEPRLRHLHAQVLGLVAACNAGTVVVGQHHHRPAGERRVEDPFAADVHVVDVHQRKHRIAPATALRPAWT